MACARLIPAQPISVGPQDPVGHLPSHPCTPAAETGVLRSASDTGALLPGSHLQGLYLQCILIRHPQFLPSQ
jgi:hypothetical protein